MGCGGMLKTRCLVIADQGPHVRLGTRRSFPCKDRLVTTLFPTTEWLFDPEKLTSAFQGHRHVCDGMWPRSQVCWLPQGGPLEESELFQSAKETYTPTDKDLHIFSAKGTYTCWDGRYSKETVRCPVSQEPSHTPGERCQEKGSFWQVRFCRHCWSNLSLPSSDRDIISYAFSHSITRITINI